MFSLLPRCHGTARVAEVDRDTGLHAELRVGGHLLALIPGERAAQLRGELDDLRGERVRDHIGGMAVRQCDQHDEAGLAFHQRRHRVHPFAHQEVTFPMAGHGPVVGFGGPFPNVERAAQLALAVHHRVTPRPARRVPRPQIAGQFLT